MYTESLRSILRGALTVYKEIGNEFLRFLSIFVPVKEVYLRAPRSLLRLSDFLETLV